MKTICSVITVLAVSLMSCSTNRVTPSSTFVTFEVAASSVNAIEGSSSIKVIYTQAPKTAVIVEAPDNLADLLDISVKSGVLSAGLKPLANVSGSTNVTVHVSSPSLRKIDMSSASNLEIVQGLVIDGNLSVDASSAASISMTGLIGNNVSIDCSSSARVLISGINVAAVSAEASSAAQIDLAGECRSVSFEASSAASINASELKSEGGHASASSAGSISSGSSNLHKEVSSGGSIDC